MYKAPIREDLSAILYARAKREDKNINALINEILAKALWNEPEVMFKGRNYRVETDLFGNYIPEPEPSSNKAVFLFIPVDNSVLKNAYFYNAYY